jgi:hypothetical protein
MPVIRLSRYAFVLVLTVAGCGASAPATPAPTLADARCVPGDPVLSGVLVTALTPGYTLRNIYYVRSRDFTHVEFFSGDLEGPGLAGTDDIGTWAVDLANGSNTFYEVNDLAGQYSGWVPSSASQYSMSDDGAAQSAACAASA